MPGNNTYNMRDKVVIAVWTNTLPVGLEATLKAETTPTGSIYSDLTSLHNQYMTALTALATAGITRPANASNLTDAGKLQVIDIAKELMNAAYNVI